MSKIGKINIAIPEKVKVTLSGSNLMMEGPLGKNNLSLDLNIFELNINEGKEVSIKPKTLNQEIKKKWGLNRSLINNAIKGVNEGYSKILELTGVGFRAAIKGPEELVYLFFIIGIGLANGANQFLVAIIATLITLTILYIRKIYSDKKNVNSLSETSTNILQIQIDNKTIKSNDIIDKLKKNVNYLNLKSFASDNESEQFNFWFDTDKDNISHLISEIEKITLENKDIKIQIFSRSGVYE